MNTSYGDFKFKFVTGAIGGIYIYSKLARIRLLGRFTTCLAQTTTASRLLFALGWQFMPRE